jgi:hypothetical protein
MLSIIIPGITHYSRFTELLVPKQNAFAVLSSWGCGLNPRWAFFPLPADRHPPDSVIGLTGLGDRHHPDSLIFFTGIRILTANKLLKTIPCNDCIEAQDVLGNIIAITVVFKPHNIYY